MNIRRGQVELPTQNTKKHRKKARVLNTVARNISRNQMILIARQAGALLRRLPRRKPRRMSIIDSIIRLTTRKRVVLGQALGRSSRNRGKRGLSRTPQTSTHSRPGGLDLNLSLRPIRSMTPKRTATFIALTAGTINGTSTRQVQASGVAS
jgi:hypothetical protein